VKGLGSFLEIEVVLKERLSDTEGLYIAQTLAKEFGIMENHLAHVAYVDLLYSGQRPSPRSVSLAVSPYYCGCRTEGASRSVYTNCWISWRSRSVSAAFLFDI
jgi:hypothetical protein